MIRRYNYHVVTPFRRFQNLEALLNMLTPMPVLWHLLLDEGLPFSLRLPAWCTVYSCPKSEPFWSYWADSLNRFISRGFVDQNPKSRYLILNDDDFYEPDFFDKIDKRDGEVIICSMIRGHNIPAGVIPERAHPTHTLTAAPESVQVGHIGAEQMVCSGRIFSAYGFNNTIAADGERICKIASENPPEFAPEANVWFNYLEPGRWNK